MLWVLCPLLVTANNLLDGEISMFKGKSPRGKERPAGVKDQPFESKIFSAFGLLVGVWATACIPIAMMTVNNDNLIFIDFLIEK
jgi:hypothetical protein